MPVLLRRPGAVIQDILGLCENISQVRQALCDLAPIISARLRSTLPRSGAESFQHKHSFPEGQMKIINSIVLCRRLHRPRTGGAAYRVVPTMGYLHEGHASLLREGRKRGDVLVLSIFVKPIQFGKNEDLDSYPRNMERDFQIADACGVDIVFIPTAAEMYPAGFQTGVTVRDISLPLCGASRPGHFDGVATVVAKLFNIVRPDVALFGRKDYQQTLVIERMVADLNVPIDVRVCPIVREPDGLAMSSRNAYLSDDERQSAPAFPCRHAGPRAVCRRRAVGCRPGEGSACRY